jgi:hypothetical protein
VLTKQAGNLEPDLHRIGEEAILQAEGPSFNTKEPGRCIGLLHTYTRLGKLGWLPIGEINQKHPLSLLSEDGERATHLRLGIIRMCGNHQSVIRHRQLLLSLISLPLLLDFH